jgi:hypothetical protein
VPSLRAAGAALLVSFSLLLSLHGSSAATRLPIGKVQRMTEVRTAKKRRKSGAAEASDGETRPATHTREATLAEEWPFETHFNDHFETPKRAFRDIRPALRACARERDVDCGRLRVYDPYFCRGAMVTHMNELGFETVINEKRDFYADIENGQVVI